MKEVLPSFSEYLRGTAQQQRDGKVKAKVADMQIHYHVEGDINAVYSEILIRRLCGGAWLLGYIAAMKRSLWQAKSVKY